MKKLFTLTIALMAMVSIAKATPSTQIWIPSTDIQKYKTGHLNIDAFIADSDSADGARKAPMSVIGPTFGLLSFEKVQAEAGFDLINQGAGLDRYPLYFHGKIGTPENSLCKDSPALAAGMYNAGTRKDSTNQNILYAIAAKTLPVAGRLSAGYYTGNKNVLVDETGSPADNGLLLSWDRTMTEISDKLWLAADYQGGQSALGAFSFGAAWAFAPNTSVIFGYDIYNNPSVAGRNTFTVQVDINFP
ncbi:MAG: hypothetical protein PHP45_05365 [Elusimicrobiales bacterium]|nr:hypothetical protein [Elusimicrobiales bacterium]